MLSRKKRKKYRFHSDDAKKDDSRYLVFPLKMDELQKMEQCRKKAYCRAIGVKGKSGPVLMNRLSERIESAGEMGLARPTLHRVVLCGAHGTSTFNSPVLMNRLHEREESSGDVGVARPDTPRGGIVWCAWYFDIQ